MMPVYERMIYDANLVQGLNAEIVALKAENAMMTEQAFKFRNLCIEKDALITDLATALALMDPANPTPDIEAAIPWVQKLPGLFERAKEATRLN
jgi:hypothetical protein